MYMGAVRWSSVPTKYRQYSVAGERRGTSCPPGQTVIATGKDYKSGKSMVRCGIAPPMAPTPAPAPPPPSQTQVTVSPTFQQTFTPQVSPVMTVQSGSGTVSAGTSQQADTGQTGTGGGQGITAADLAAILAQQQAAAEAARQADRDARQQQQDLLAAQLAQQQQAYAQQQADLLAAQQAAADKAAQDAANQQREGPTYQPGNVIVSEDDTPQTEGPTFQQPPTDNKTLLIGGSVAVAALMLFALSRKKKR